MTFPEGTQRIVCDTDLDNPSPGNGNGNGVPGDGDANNPQFGAFLGQGEWVVETDPSIPTCSLGTSDLSIEFLCQVRTGDTSILADDLFWLCGLATDSGGGTTANAPFAGVYPVVASSTRFRFRWGGPNAASVDILDFTPRVGWTHLCVNYDRSGNMEVFEDGSSVGVSDISLDVAFSIPLQGIYPVISQRNTDGINDNLADNPLLLILPWGTPIGGFALHSRILTGPEITANAAAFDVGDYTETEARYNFNSFVDGSGTRVAPPTQEVDLDNIQLFNKWTVPSPQDAELFVPGGSNGTLHIEDLSGSGRHFGLQTQASYGSSTLADRGRVGFAATGAAP